MTLILALANRDYTIQLSDRRLTTGRTIATEDAGKAGVLVCDDARLAFGFSGLAGVGSFRTQPWLLSTLGEVAAPEHRAQAIMDRLKERLTREFSINLSIKAAPPSHRCLSVLFSGYLYQAEPPYIVQSLVSNFQDFESGYDSADSWDEFKCYYFTEKRPNNGEATLIQRIGMWPAFPDDDPTLRRMLQERKPARAVVGKALEIFETAAQHPRAHGTVGQRISVIVLPPDYTQQPETRYHTDVNSSTAYFPDQVMARSDTGVYMLMDPQITQLPGIDGTQGYVAVPKVGRNAPCPCLSGKKYKKCHGQMQVRG